MEDTKPRHCIRCGEEGPFRNELAIKCTSCDQETEVERRDYHQEYHKARGRAMSRLTKRFPHVWEQYLLEEREALRNERETEMLDAQVSDILDARSRSGRRTSRRGDGDSKAS